MKKYAALVFLIFLLSGSSGDDGEPKSRRKRFSLPVSSLLSAAPKIFQQLYDLWHVLLRNPSIGIKDAVMRSQEHEIISRITTINQQMSRLESKVNGIFRSTVQTIMTALPQTIKSELGLEELTNIIEQIDLAQNEFHDYLAAIRFNKTIDDISLPMMMMTTTATRKVETNTADMYVSSEMIENEVNPVANPMRIMKKRETDQIEPSTLLSFATWATSHGSDSVKTLLGRMHKILVPLNELRTGIFQLVSQEKELGTNVCNMKESPHQILYNLYNTVSLADYKGYVMLQFSYMILRLYDKGNFTIESKRETEKFERRVEEKASAIRNALTNADRSIYNCDPKQYVEGLSFVRLTKLLQGYIENEVNLNPYGTCRENCAFYFYTEYHGCYKEQFCSKQEQCRGKVVECQYVDSDMNICKSSGSERRYEWVEYENGRTLGTKGKCQTRNLFQVDSWWRYLFWHCSYCLCLCDDGVHNSDRYFNLRESTSDIKDNKVVTGIRITKHNRIIHLQIQQGVLSPRGVIDKSTISWKPVDNYTVTDLNVQNGVDYHTMSWMDRIMDIDEASGPPEHVLTGVRLRKLGSHLNLEIRTTPINFTSGQVYPEVHSTWLSNDNTEVSRNTPRKEIILTNPDIPIRYEAHTLNSHHDQFIKFQATSFDADAGQNTVPYFDAQPLISKGFPLSGLGFIHRGKPGSGGFIAPKLISYDFRPHV